MAKKNNQDKASKVARPGYMFAGKKEFKLSWFKGVTLDHAIEVHKGSKVSENSIRKVWKVANGLTKPNYLNE